MEAEKRRKEAEEAELRRQEEDRRQKAEIEARRKVEEEKARLQELKDKEHTDKLQNDLDNANTRIAQQVPTKETGGGMGGSDQGDGWGDGGSDPLIFLI